MSLLVKFEVKELSLMQKEIKQVAKDIFSSKDSALSSVGFFASKEYRKFIKSNGNGKWPKYHPLTTDFKRAGKSILGKEPKESQFERISAFMKYIKKGDSVSTGFSFNINSFNPKLEKIVDKIVNGYDIDVTPKMMRFFAAQGFPLMEKTKVLSVPKRPLIEAQNQIGEEVFSVFINKFFNSLSRKNPIFKIS